jgi:hypothetical protein
MIEYNYNHAKSVNPVAHDAPGTVKFAEYVVNGSPGMSLSYSWEIGNVHFVQLNNFLTYRNVVDGYNIRSAYSWLIKDLDDAKRRRKTIILNLHKPCSVLTTATVNGECGSSQVLGADGAIISDIYLISEFKNLLTNYPVSAIFTGHLHPSQGFRQFQLSNGTLVPLFISGSQDFGTLLKAWLSERNLAVYKVKIDHYLENVTPLQRATETYIGTWTLR